MKRVGVGVAGACMLVAGGLAFGQQDAVVPKDVLDDFEQLVGSWRMEGSVGDTPFEGDWSTTWARGKHCLLLNWSSLMGGQKLHFSGTIGWDAASGRVNDWGFVSNGDSRVIRFRREGPLLWVGELAGVVLGESVEVEASFRKTAPGEMTYRSKTAEGATVVAVMRRPEESERAQAPPSNYEHLKDLESFIGTWTAKGKVPDGAEMWAGEEYTVRMSARWIANKNALDVDWRFSIAGMRGSGKGLWCWNTAENRIEGLGIDSFGGHSHETWKREGDMWIISARGTRFDGKPETSVNHVVFTSKDRQVHEVTDMAADGKPQPDMRMVYERVSE